MGQAESGGALSSAEARLDFAGSALELEARFLAPSFRALGDRATRQQRIAGLVAGEIIPRLATLHQLVRRPDGRHPGEEEIAELARLVLSPDPQAAAAYVVELREQGLSMETLFVELLEPAARHLGEMWTNDQCDFIDVTLGVGRLQKLLAVFNCTHELAAASDRRAVLLLSPAGEQHGFGLTMVAKFLEAAGWQVVTSLGASAEKAGRAAAARWYAAAGVTMAGAERLTEMAELVAEVRARSLNPAIGVMVGGPAFRVDPSLVAAVGADGTAADAPTAVLMAQKLFDIGHGARLAG